MWSPSAPLESPLSAEEAIAEIEAGDRKLTPPVPVVMRTVQAIFDLLAGRSFGSLKDNKDVTSRINRLLRKYGLRVSCAKILDKGKACGVPSVLRCNARDRIPNGAFIFAKFPPFSMRWSLPRKIHRTSRKSTFWKSGRRQRTCWVRD